jgi:hypothetical protein
VTKTPITDFTERMRGATLEPWQRSVLEKFEAAGPFGRTVFLGVDMGKPGSEYTACVCARCATPHRWQNRAPKRCRHCETPFNFAGLQTIK